jgi:hypothetical protein
MFSKALRNVYRCLGGFRAICCRPMFDDFGIVTYIGHGAGALAGDGDQWIQ